MTDQASDRVVLRTCPHLGLEDDPSACRLYTSADHRCYRWRRTEPVEISYQLAFCLSADYRDCFRLVSPGNGFSFPRARAPRIMRRRRLLLFVAVASALLLLLASLSSSSPYWPDIYRGIGDASSAIDFTLAGVIPSDAPFESQTPALLEEHEPSSSAPTLLPSLEPPSTTADPPSAAIEGTGETATGAATRPTTPEQPRGVASVTTPTPPQQSATPLAQPAAPTVQSAVSTPRPAAPTPPAAPAVHRVYLVQAGDNLYRVASRFGVTVEEIVKANGLKDESFIWAGQSLVIP